MGRGHIFLNRGKTANRFAEDVVGDIVVHSLDFANQDIAALAPKGVPIARH